jgi:hypothetical protein
MEEHLILLLRPMEPSLQHRPEGVRRKNDRPFEAGRSRYGSIMKARRSIGVPSPIHLMPEAVTRAEVGPEKQGSCGVSGKQISRQRRSGFNRFRIPIPRSCGRPIDMSCTLVKPSRSARWM